MAKLMQLQFPFIKKRLVVSFSGGRTSAFMLWYLLNEWPDRGQWDIIVVFANTGKEVEGTLKFVNDCSVKWGVKIFWLEYRPATKKGWGVNVKITDYYEASRRGEPFESMIDKMGIPSTNTPFCSTVLKQRTIQAFIRKQKIGDCCIAIGMRADEIDRMSVDRKRHNVIYPLITMRPTFLKEILEWWAGMDFDLVIHPDDGNCDNCWKKDFKRLIRNVQRRPEGFDWWQFMTDRYGYFNPRDTALKPPYNFYRSNMSPKDLFVLAGQPAERIEELIKNSRLDGCSETCEAF